MNIFVLFLQIGDLFKGNLSWRGLLYLCLFVLMALLAIGITMFAGYKTFQPKKKLHLNRPKF